MSHTTRHLRNVKHIGSITHLKSEVDEYLKSLSANHSNHAAKVKFSPARTSNPDVAAQWEARVQELHAKVRVLRKPKARTFDPAHKQALMEMAFYFNKYGAPF